MACIGTFKKEAGVGPCLKKSPFSFSILFLTFVTPMDAHFKRTNEVMKEGRKVGIRKNVRNRLVDDNIQLTSDVRRRLTDLQNHHCYVVSSAPSLLFYIFVSSWISL